MQKLTFTQGECQAVTDTGDRFFLSYEDYPDLAALYEQAVEIVGKHRTPEQKKIDDVVALAVSADPDSAYALIPDWEPWKGYRIGEHVVYGDTIYRILQSHRSQHDWKPDQLPALYTPANKATEDPVDGYPEWVQPTGGHDAYNKGDRVLWEGKVWKSIIDNNVWPPEGYPAGWGELDNVKGLPDQ